MAKAEHLDVARSRINQMISELEEQHIDALTIAIAMAEYSMNYVESFLPAEDQKTVWHLFREAADAALADEDPARTDMQSGDEP